MSMSAQPKRFTEEFKIEAVRQVTERGHRVADVAERLGVSAHSLYQWRKRYGQADCTAEHQALSQLLQEVLA